MKRAAVAYLPRQGRILVVWNRRYRGWTMPGGMVEPGESLEMACMRELLEETGLYVLSLSPVFDGLHDGDDTVTRSSHVYVFRVTAQGEPVSSEPGCPVSWFTQDDLLACTPFPGFYNRMFAALGSTSVPKEQQP